MSVYQKIGLVGLLAMVLMGALSVMPPTHEDAHSHSPGPHDKLEKVPLEPEEPALAQIAKPALQVWRFVMPDTADAHYPFPKYCGHGNFVKPNHFYYFNRDYWSNGYHYHKGFMDHGVGADYNYTFRCGGPGGHYETLPQGWF